MTILCLPRFGVAITGVKTLARTVARSSTGPAPTTVLGCLRVRPAIASFVIQ